MIRDPEHLRQTIRDAETIAARLEYRGLTMTIGERRVIADKLRDLAAFARLSDAGRRKIAGEGGADGA